MGETSNVSYLENNDLTKYFHLGYIKSLKLQHKPNRPIKMGKAYKYALHQR